ncbi:MAG: potassium channel family protein [Rhodobacteraceae bacterium]|nr:potassium channel family protein [Paracoccaceae bacterium]
MTLPQQIMWGSLFLGLCLIIHTLVLAFCTDWVGKLAGKIENWRFGPRIVALMLISLAVIVFAHTAQVWIWAAVYIHYGALADWNDAIYFSLVTYTSLGYGDIVLGPGLRIFAAFASVTGLLGFGLSTAYLVALFGRLMTWRANH